jgi:hypothetical protein
MRRSPHNPRPYFTADQHDLLERAARACGYVTASGKPATTRYLKDRVLEQARRDLVAAGETDETEQ